MPRALSVSFLLACAVADNAVVVPVYDAQAQVSAARSYELWVLQQVRLSGEPITCSELINRDTVPSAADIVVLAHVSGEVGDTILLTHLPAGEQSRLFYVDLFDGLNGIGAEVGAGCQPSVTIEAGKRVDVSIEVRAP